ncbi:IclR family transcriptional regulator [Actinacidiphila rubida]|uniref:Transcriptional regulator, IclR family n=1 Tax=Actinacidiphila rubida TaxID=310780 RepID=A0A1H8KPP7_9ACTN|nr:IclR family transcriptional regulator [Actinacidiphila rubida]SEN94751.1 transcriptional regulator, IclR family [Actinacidiphila rubida]
MAKTVNTRTTEQGRVKGPTDKAMEVLEALVEPGGPHRLGDLAQRTGLTKPTVHRHLQTMVEFGFAQPADGGRYQAGPRLLGLAAAALHDDQDLRLARPVLAELHRRTGQFAHYAVRHGDVAVHLEHSESPPEFRMGVPPGGRTPLYLSGVGLAMLSALPPDACADVLDAVPADEWAAHPLGDAATVREVLREAAERGYAVDDGYGEPDVRSVAAPVLDRDGHVVGAVGISGLTFTLDRESVLLFGPMVRASARAVSAGLGGRAPALGVAGRTAGERRGPHGSGRPAMGEDA